MGMKGEQSVCNEEHWPAVEVSESFTQTDSKVMLDGQRSKQANKTDKLIVNKQRIAVPGYLLIPAHSRISGFY